MSLKQILGKKAEKQALKYLKRQGLQLITKNYLTKVGEIDIIMIDDNTLVFVEVRYRLNNFYGDAIDTINSNKQQKIIRTAEIFLQKYEKYENFICRFDVIGIKSNLKYRKPSVINKIKYLLTDNFYAYWIKDAFELTRRY